MENSYTPNAPPPPYPNQNVPLYPTQDGAYGVSGHQNSSGEPVIHNPNTIQVLHQQRQTPVIPLDYRSAFDIPVATTCSHCHLAITTTVDVSIKNEGWLWCIICSCLFSIIVGCLACCLNGFKKFTHSCPNCGHILAEVEPKLSRKEISIIGAIIALSVLLIVVVVIWNGVFSITLAAH